MSYRIVSCPVPPAGSAALPSPPTAGPGRPAAPQGRPQRARFPLTDTPPPPPTPGITPSSRRRVRLGSRGPKAGTRPPRTPPYLAWRPPAPPGYPHAAAGAAGEARGSPRPRRPAAAFLNRRRAYSHIHSAAPASRAGPRTAAGPRLPPAPPRPRGCALFLAGGEANAGGRRLCRPSDPRLSLSASSPHRPAPADFPPPPAPSAAPAPPQPGRAAPPAVPPALGLPAEAARRRRALASPRRAPFSSHTHTPTLHHHRFQPAVRRPGWCLSPARRVPGRGGACGGEAAFPHGSLHGFPFRAGGFRKAPVGVSIPSPRHFIFQGSATRTVNAICGIIALGGGHFSRRSPDLLLATSIPNLPRSLPGLPLSYWNTLLANISEEAPQPRSKGCHVSTEGAKSPS